VSTTAEHEGATDDVPDATEPAAPAPAPTPTFARRARTVSHVLISSALAITLAAALAGSVEPRPGASFFTAEATTATQVSALSSTLGAGLDEDQQLDGAIEVLATANALADGEVTAPVEQARAELGMLLATYLAQQDAARRVPVQVVPDGGLDLDESLDDAEVPALPEPLDPGTGTDDPALPGTDDQGTTPAGRPAQQPASVDAAGDADVVRTSATRTAPSPSPTSSPDPSASPSPSGSPSPSPSGDAPTGPTGPGSTGGTTSPDDRTLPEDAVPAPDGVAPGELDGTSDDSADPSPDSGDGEHGEDDDHAHGDVTLEDVVVSATHLADLLGTDFSPVGVVPAAGVTALAGTTLAERLAEVVERYAGSTAQYQNGRIPPEALCALDFAPGKTLRCDAAEQLEALAAEFQKEFGYALKITDAYRPYDDQVRLKAIKPYLAAVPGTSQHGWGLAIDIGGNVPSGTSREYVWLRTHGPDYGWDNPAWARPNGSKPEPWHFEFFAAGKMPTRYTPSEGTTPTTPQKPSTPTPPPAPKPTPTPPTEPTKPTEPTEPTTPTEPEEPAKVAVPAGLVGTTQAQAAAALANAGFKVSVTTQEDAAAAGTVIAVNPGSGTELAKGSTVTIVVSTGPAVVEPEPEPTPDPEPTDPAPTQDPTVAPTSAPTEEPAPGATETTAP